MKTLILTCLVSAMSFWPISVRAQSVRGYAMMGSTALGAKQTFDAVAGLNRRPSMGGGLQVNVWKGLFADASVSQLKLHGERVFLDGGTLYRLGIPLDITFQPLDVAGGWRANVRRASLYAGIGVSFLSYKETSKFAGSDDDVNQTHRGRVALGGIDVHLNRWFLVGGEVRYRTVPGILGITGVSADFGEHSAGGLATSFRVSVGG